MEPLPWYQHSGSGRHILRLLKKLLKDNSSRETFSYQDYVPYRMGISRGRLRFIDTPSAQEKQPLSAFAMSQTKVIDYYEALGVPSNATLKDINSAYKRLALKHHPDKVAGGDVDEFQKVLDYPHLISHFKPIYTHKDLSHRSKKQPKPSATPTVAANTTTISEPTAPDDNMRSKHSSQDREASIPNGCRRMLAHTTGTVMDIATCTAMPIVCI